MQCKVWQNGTAEPGSWEITNNYSTAPRTTTYDGVFAVAEAATVGTLYEFAYTGYVGPVPNETFASVRVLDLYDNSTLAGYNVTIGTATNVTDGSGVATVYNFTGLNYSVDGGALYFNASGTATENSTVNASLIGAEYSFTASNLVGATLSTFNISTSSQTNTTTTGTTSIILKPNTTNDVTITIPDYLSRQDPVVTGGRDLGTYSFTNLSQSIVTINMTIGPGGTPVSTFNISWTGPSNGSTGTTNGTAHFPALFGTYNVTATPAPGTAIPETAAITVNTNSTAYTFITYQSESFFFTIRDEITKALITNNITIELISEAETRVITTTSGDSNESLLTPGTYTIRYRSTNDLNYTERAYIAPLTSQSIQNITLYVLHSDSATTTTTTVQDTSQTKLQGAVVKLLRYYVGCNCYEIVAMGATSAAGQAYMISQAYDGHYKWAVDYEGQNRFLSATSEQLLPVGSLITRSFTLNLGASYFSSYRDLTHIGRSLVYNNETKALSFSWSDPANIVTQGCLYASYLDGIAYTDVTPACGAGSTGSVFLILNDSVRSWKYYAEIETDTTYSEYVLFSGFIDKKDSVFLTNRAFGAYLGTLVIVAMALIMSFSAIGVVLVTALGVISLTALGLISLGSGFAIGFTTIVLGFGLYMMRR